VVRTLFWKEVAVTDLKTAKLNLICKRVVQTARLMVGVPDYENYVQHRRTAHPGGPIMSYEAFFRERLDARYAIGKGRFRGCC
jgi:uncharacterized short protein YbdD (DUF466 family)